MTDQAVSQAQQILHVRKRRRDYFKAELFDEQDWDLMLLLYVAGAEGRHVDRDDVLEQIAVRPAVLDRWIAVLEKEQIVERNDETGDGLCLSDEAQAKMHRLLTSVFDA